MKPENFHTPVLPDAVLTYLVGDRSGIYVDCTLGGGGHSLAILQSLAPAGRIIGIDWDEQAIQRAGQRLAGNESRVILRQGNFRQITQILQDCQVAQVDGILADLGVSSHQIDRAERGFSYLQDGPLDMRMAATTQLTAREVINSYAESELVAIFRNYGEERAARSIARAIVQQRQLQPITSTQQLARVIEARVPYGQRIKTLARIFQAVRMEVNGELENLQGFLTQAVGLLRSGGRLVIVAYHSLEDRLVKDFLRQQSAPCQCPPELPVCVCGQKPLLRLLTPKVIRPSTAEIAANPRSRSARLRAAERI